MANKLDIVFENPDIVAVNKETGLLSIPDRDQSEISLKELLAKKYGKIFTIHRLDRDTSGLILYAKNEIAHKYFSTLFSERRVIKTYVGVVVGSMPNEAGSILAPIGENPAVKGKMNVHRNGKPSHTDYKVLDGFPQFSIVEFTLHTGRTHQIRVHTKELGAPLVCDPLYGDGKPLLLSDIKKKYRLGKNIEEERPIINRLALHSYRLQLKLQDDSDLTLEAPLPKEFVAVANQLRKANDKRKML